MADDNATELVKRSTRRFSAKQSLNSLRQEIALNFAPHLASFTTTIEWGQDFAAHLVESAPTLIARDFVGQIGAMLRPTGKQWFNHRSAMDEVNEDTDSRTYLDWRSRQLMRIMSDRVTGSGRALKEADEFLALFGDACLSVDLSPDQSHLVMSNWHTRDVVWVLGADQRPNVVTRRETLTSAQVMQRFRQNGIDKIHSAMRELAEKDPDREVEIRHDVLPIEDYDPITRKMSKAQGAYCSIWTDVANNHVIRETPQRTMRYVIVRWRSLPSSPYAYSPCAMVALPDSRLHQQMAMSLLEAAEKSVRPPVIGQSDMIKGDVRLGAGEITWVDSEYDERSGEALRPLQLADNPRLGVEMVMRTEGQLLRAFFLDKLRMPDTRNSKSTVEVQFLIDEYVRAAVPLFGPLHEEYNVPLLLECDTLAEQTNGYGGREVPEMLRFAGGDLVFAWDNPLTEMLERQEAHRMAEVGTVAQQALVLEQGAAQSEVLQQIDIGKMSRTAITGLGGAKWLRSEVTVKKMQQAKAEQLAQQQQQQTLLQNAGGISQLVDSGINAAQALSEVPNPGGPPLLPAPV